MPCNVYEVNGWPSGCASIYSTALSTVLALISCFWINYSSIAYRCEWHLHPYREFQYWIPLIFVSKSNINLASSITNLFDRHYDLHRIQAVQTKIIWEVRGRSKLLISGKYDWADVARVIIPSMGRKPVKEEVSWSYNSCQARKPTLSKFFSRSTIRPSTSGFDRLAAAE